MNGGELEINVSFHEKSLIKDKGRKSLVASNDAKL